MSASGISWNLQDVKWTPTTTTTTTAPGGFLYPTYPPGIYSPTELRVNGNIVAATLNTFTTGNQRMNVNTRTVQVKAGYLGQVLHNGVIVWESSPRKNATKAHRAAERRVAEKTAQVFA